MGYFNNFVACGASFDDGSSERTSNGTRMQKQELAAQNQGPSGNAAGVLPGPLNNGKVAPMQ